jgi:hypothetical protein
MPSIPMYQVPGDLINLQVRSVRLQKKKKKTQRWSLPRNKICKTGSPGCIDENVEKRLPPRKAKQIKITKVIIFLVRRDKM